jgi:hypothetical protein
MSEVHMHWRKSSRSGPSGCVEVAFAKSSHSSDGACVEVGVARTSSHSGQLHDCVEVEGLPEGWVAVRDNERPDEVVRVSPESWRAFIAGVKDNEFDLP